MSDRAVTAMGLALAAHTPSDVAVSVRPLNGRDVVWAEFTTDDRTAPLTTESSLQLARAARAARSHRLPLVIVLATSGAAIDEGIPALHAWGTVAAAMVQCSGIVPMVMIVDGPAVSGPALLLGIADLTVMTADSYAFVNGPTMVEEFTGIGIGVEELGGAANHGRYTGVATMVVADRDAAVEAVGDLLAYLPDHVDAEPPRRRHRRPGRSQLPRGRRTDPTDIHRELRRPQGRRRHRRRRLDAGVEAAVGGERRDGVRHHRRSTGGHRRQPTDHARRHARHPGIAEGRSIRCDVRRVQPADRHPGRHTRLLPRQGPRVAGNDPPRRTARLRLRPSDGATDLRDPAQELRRRLHRHGLQDDGQRSLPGMAVGRAGRDGCRAGSSDPAATRDARGTRRVRTRLRAPAAQPVRRRRARARRRRDRSGRHPPRDRRCARCARRQARSR